MRADRQTDRQTYRDTLIITFCTPRGRKVKMDKRTKLTTKQDEWIAATWTLLTEVDLGMFSMFGRTGAPTKRGPHKRTWAENNHVITKYSVNVG